MDILNLSIGGDSLKSVIGDTIEVLIVASVILNSPVFVRMFSDTLEIILFFYDVNTILLFFYDRAFISCPESRDIILL